MSEAVNFFLLYTSTISYAVFFHAYYDRLDELKDTLLFFLPLTAVFYLIMQASFLIPNEFFGMLAKTFTNFVIFAVYFQRKMKIGFLSALAKIILVSVIVMFSQLILMTFADLSYYTHYLSMEQPVLFTFFFSLLSNVIEVCGAILLAKHIRKYRMNSLRIPTRYLLIALLSLITVIFQGAMLFYFNTSSERFPLPLMILFILPALIAAALPLYILSNEARLRKVIARLPVFVSTQAHLNRQMDYLKRQSEELEKAKQSLLDYRKQGDFTVSINDVYHSREHYFDGLYTDNPAVHTLLSYYADRFEKEGIRYSFKMHCSTYTGLSDYFLIYLFSGLLDHAKQYAKLSFSRTANIYTIVFETDETMIRDLQSFVQSAALLSGEHQTMTFEREKNRLRLVISAFS